MNAENPRHVQPQEISRAELARRLGVSRTYVTLLLNNQRTPSHQVANKIRQLLLAADVSQRMHGPLAQLAEQLTLNQQVTGSIPVRLMNTTTHKPNPAPAPTNHSLLFDAFIHSRRQGISPQSIRFYRICLKKFLDNYPPHQPGSP